VTNPLWLTRGVRGIGVVSLLSDLGHEVGLERRQTLPLAVVAAVVDVSGR
jgi:hypothetical protein